MNRILVLKIVVVFALIAAACGGGAETTPTAAPSTSSSAAPGTTATPGTSTTTTLPAGTDGSDVPECLRVWPEGRVQEIAGDSFALLNSSADGLACIFSSGSRSVAVFMRPGDQSIFDQAETGADLAGGAEDQAICDGGYSTDVGGIVVVEALDLDRALIFNVALSGVDDPIAAARQLLGDACS